MKYPVVTDDACAAAPAVAPVNLGMSTFKSPNRIIWLGCEAALTPPAAPDPDDGDGVVDTAAPPVFLEV